MSGGIYIPAWLVAVIVLAGLAIVALGIVVALLVWFFAAREERIHRFELDAADGLVDLGPIPVTLGPRDPVGDATRYFLAKRGMPVFVVPFADYLRIGFKGSEAARGRIDEKQFVTISPVSWSLDLARRLQFEKVSPESGVVPSGTLTDYASIPSPLRWLVGQPTGLVARAAIVHDFGYRSDAAAERSTARRRDWDRTMLKLMRQDGVSPARRILIYWGVRLGGGRAYRAGSDRLGDTEYQELLESVASRTEDFLRELPGLFDLEGLAALEKGDLKPRPQRVVVGYRPRPGFERVIEMQDELTYGTRHPTDEDRQAKAEELRGGPMKRLWTATGARVVRALRGY